MNYLYNGVELPALPEWDREAYPYAVLTRTTISSVNIDTYYLRCSDVLAVYMESNCYYASTAKTYTFCCSATEPTAWDDLGSENKEAGYILGNPLWTSHDILNSDGTLYLAASEPVPVPQYTATYDLKSFLMGVVDELAGKP